MVIVAILDFSLLIKTKKQSTYKKKKTAPYFFILKTPNTKRKYKIAQSLLPLLG